jgi:hypothetical protein
MPSKEIGTVPPKSVGFVVKVIDLNGLTGRRFSFFITARNGYVSQKLALKKVNGEWRKASKITAELSNHPSQTVDETDPDFPRGTDGQVLWD